MASIVGSLASIGKVPTVASTQAAALTPIQNFIKNGIPIGWLGLFVLAGGIPFQPFSFLGYGGMNLFAVGSTVWGASKAALQAMCLLASKLISAYYPKLWYISWLIVLNPWYIFDLVQMFSPAFNKEGYKVPFLGIKVGTAGKKNADGTYAPISGRVTAVNLTGIIGLLCTGAYSLTEYIPTEIMGAYKPMLQTGILVAGSTSALAGGGLGAFAALPQVFSALKSSTGEVQTALAAPAPAAPIPAPAAPAPAAPAPAQKGGAAPVSLTDIANRILNENGNQSGGGHAPAGDIPTTLFLGALALITLGGISLGVVRAKAAEQ